MDSGIRPDVLLLPKVESHVEVDILESHLTGRQAGIRLMALIETALGLQNADAIAQSSERVSALVFGGADLTTDLGSGAGWEPMLFARSRLVQAAATAGPVIGQNDNVIAVNSFIEIDLLGQVNAEFLLGHQFTAPGGQMDFVRGAQRSKGGKSFVAASSTAAQGKVSRIVPRLSAPVTDPRMEVEYVVTEFGICNLRGKSSTERARALIEIAHPTVREELAAAAEEAGFWWSEGEGAPSAPSGAAGTIRR